MAVPAPPGAGAGRQTRTLSRGRAVPGRGPPESRPALRSQRSSMKLSLEVMTEGKQQGKLLPIALPQFVIGRDPQCHLRPASPSISKRHCAILQRENRAFVRDFDSTNGTFVNERQIKGEIELQNSDKLRIGPIVFTVHLEAGDAVNRPTP